jgi:hypothetical protein
MYRRCSFIKRIMKKGGKPWKGRYRYHLQRKARKNKTERYSAYLFHFIYLPVPVLLSFMYKLRYFCDNTTVNLDFSFLLPTGPLFGRHSTVDRTTTFSKMLSFVIAPPLSLQKEAKVSNIANVTMLHCTSLRYRIQLHVYGKLLTLPKVIAVDFRELLTLLTVIALGSWNCY